MDIKLYNDGDRFMIVFEGAFEVINNIIGDVVKQATGVALKINVFNQGNQIMFVFENASETTKNLIRNTIQSFTGDVPTAKLIPAIEPLKKEQMKAPDVTGLIPEKSIKDTSKRSVAEFLKDEPEFALTAAADTSPDFLKEIENEKAVAIDVSASVIKEKLVITTKTTEPVKKAIEIKEDKPVLSFELLSYDDLNEFFCATKNAEKMQTILEKNTYLDVNEFLLLSLEEDLKDAYANCLSA